MKNLLLLSIVLIACMASSVNAKPVNHKNWRVNQHGVAVVVSSSGSQIGMIADGGWFSVTSSSWRDKCDPLSYEKHETKFNVDGTWVKFESFCNRGIKKVGYGVMTNKGNSYIIDLFKRSTSVTIGRSIISGMGFSTALKTYYDLYDQEGI